MISAGTLDREIVLQTATLSQDAETGEELPDWTAVESETLWATWLPAGSIEAYRASQRLGASVDGVFRIYDRDPRPSPTTNRIVFDGRTFDIKPYVEIGRGDGLDIPAVARAD